MYIYKFGYFYFKLTFCELRINLRLVIYLEYNQQSSRLML